MSLMNSRVEDEAKLKNIKSHLFKDYTTTNKE